MEQWNDLNLIQYKKLKLNTSTESSAKQAFEELMIQILKHLTEGILEE